MSIVLNNATTSARNATEIARESVTPSCTHCDGAPVLVEMKAIVTPVRVIEREHLLRCTLHTDHNHTTTGMPPAEGKIANVSKWSLSGIVSQGNKRGTRECDTVFVTNLLTRRLALRRLTIVGYPLRSV